MEAIGKKGLFFNLIDSLDQSSKKVMSGADESTNAQKMASSCTGALLTSLFMTPLDVLKIRLQSQQRCLEFHKCFLYSNGLMDHLCPVCENGNNGNGHWYKRKLPAPYTGTFDALLKITKSEGITSLWSGLSPTLIISLPATVIYFTSYENLRNSITSYAKVIKHEQLRDTLIASAPLVAGITARTTAATIVSPLEMIRTKMQSKKIRWVEIGDLTKAMIKADGWRSLYRGLSPTLLRDVPFSGIYWTCYEMLKAHLTLSSDSFIPIFISGAVSGTVASVITLPFDVVKTRRQIEMGNNVIYSNRPSSVASTFGIMKQIHRSSGVQGLFVGIVPRVLKVAPACAIMISTYEYGKYYFSKK